MSSSSPAGVPRCLSYLMGLVVGSMRDVVHLGQPSVRVVG
jgi:hypothetical protein